QKAAADPNAAAHHYSGRTPLRPHRPDYSVEQHREHWFVVCTACRKRIAKFHPGIPNPGEHISTDLLEIIQRQTKQCWWARSTQTTTNTYRREITPRHRHVRGLPPQRYAATTGREDLPMKK